MKDLYTKNYRTLMKEIEDNTNKEKDIQCSWTRRINFIKVFIIPKDMQIQCNPYQNTNSIFHRTGTNNLNICIELQKTLRIKDILRKKKSKVSCLLISKFTAQLQKLKHYDTHTKTDI